MEPATGTGTDTAAEPASGARHKQRPSIRTTLASLAYRDFRYLWLGQITHAFALWLEQTARPLLILALTDSAVHLGGVIAMRTLPAVILGMVAGAIADSVNRRLVLLITKVVVLGLSAMFAALVLSGRIEVWHIYTFSFLRGAAMAFDQPARRAIIPTIVPRHLIINAMALSAGTMGAMRITGAAAAGLLMGWYGISAPFVTIVFVYVGAVIFTWMLRVDAQDTKPYEGFRGLGADMIEGVKYAWHNATIRGVVIIGIGYFTFGMAFMQVFAPLFAIEVLDIGETGFGYMTAIMGVGSIVGSLALAAFNPSRGRGKLVLALLVVFGVLLMGFSGVTYATHWLVPVFFMVVLVGAAQSGFFPIINTLMVEAAPADMRGRMMGLLSLDRAMAAFGGFLAGVLAAVLGVQMSQILFGAGCVVTGVLMYAAYPPLRRIE